MFIIFVFRCECSVAVPGPAVSDTDTISLDVTTANGWVDRVTRAAQGGTVVITLASDATYAITVGAINCCEIF